MEQEKKNGGLITLVIILIVLVLCLGGYIIYDKILDKKESPIETNNISKNETNNDTTSNTELFSVENGYNEVILTNEEKEKINKELYEQFQPGNGNDPIIKLNNKNEDVFTDDCTKLIFVKWYITFNNKAGYKYDTVSDKDELGNEFQKIKYERLEEITKEMFNVENLTCKANEEDYSISSKYGIIPDENGYIWLSNAGGGYIPMAVKTLAKYENGNKYYLLIHVFEPKNIDYDNLKDYLTSYEDNTNISENSGYIKLKYGINNNKKYLIGFEYLK